MNEYGGQISVSKALQQEQYLRENAKTPASSTQYLQTIPEHRKTPHTGSAKANSPSKSQPQKYFAGLTEKQKTEAYFDLYDQNLALRAQKNELENQIKKLTTQLVRLTKDIKPSSNFDLEAQNEELLKENKALKAKLQIPKQTRPQTATFKKKPALQQPKIIERVPQYIETDLREREEIIKMLRDQLEATEAELLRAQAPRFEIPDLSSDYKEKMTRLADVENKFLSLEEAMSAQKIYLDHLRNVADESQRALKDERFKNCELEIRLRAAEMAAAGARDLAYKLKESENEKVQLEFRLKETIEAYFELEAGKKENPINFPAPSVSKLPS